MKTAKADLGELRERIARTTVEIIRAAGERNKLAQRVGRIKDGASLQPLNDDVEDALVRAVMEECNRSGVSRSAGLRILNILLTESKRVQGIAQSDSESPMDAFAKAEAMERSGRKVLRLDVGEPDFPAPRPVVEACSGALFSSKTHYTVSRGIPQLISALRTHLKKNLAYEAREDELLITTGGRFAVYASIASVVGEGESAIVIDPAWPAYKQVLSQVGAKAIVIRTTLEDEWEVSPEAVAQAIRPNTRAIVLSYPNNPTGKIIDSKTFSEIVSLANERDVTVISDEAYSGYAFKACPSVLTREAKSFVLVGTFSKTWAMTGFRVGFAVSSKMLIDRMLKLVSLMLTSVPEFVQYAAIKALACEKEAEENRTVMMGRVEAVSAELDRISSLRYYKPDGAMYFFPQAKAPGFHSSRFADRLLHEKAVSITPGTAFGNYPNSFRISLGQPEKILVEAVRRIGEAVD